MYLLDQVVIFDNHVSQHIVERKSRLDLQILAAFIYDVQDLWHQLILSL